MANKSNNISEKFNIIIKKINKFISYKIEPNSLHYNNKIVKIPCENKTRDCAETT